MMKEKLNYYVLYYLTKDKNSYICSTCVELNRTINSMEDLKLIKNMIVDEKDTKWYNIQILNIMRFPI